MSDKNDDKLLKIIDIKDRALHKAIQLCDICSDWNLEEVEIDGKMVDISYLKDILEEAYNE